MTDPTHDLRQPIDARPLVAQGAVRGAIGGFGWSLIVAVPVAVVNAIDPKVGPLNALIMFGGICSVWSAVAAFAEVRRTRERTFTEEQRDILRRNLRRTRIQAACVSVLLIALTETFSLGDGPVFKPRPCCAMIILSIAISSDLVGRAKGYKAVRAMQQETRDAACRMDAHPHVSVDDATPSALVLVARPMEPKPSADRGVED